MNRIKPCAFTILYADGSAEIADPAGAWAVYFDSTRRENVVSISADCPEYAAVASILTVLCHPAENRRIADYEKC